MTSSNRFDLLRDPAVIDQLRAEVRSRNYIEKYRLWRIGMISPDCDDIRYSIYPAKVAVLGNSRNSWRHAAEESVGAKWVYGPDGTQNVPLDAFQGWMEDYRERRMLRVIRDGWLCYHKTRVYEEDGFIPLPGGIEVESADQNDSYVPLDQFLAEEGFPVISPNAETDSIFTMEVSGVIVGVGNRGVKFIRDPSFVRRSLIDEEGVVVSLGLDEAVRQYFEGPDGLAIYNYDWVPFPVSTHPFQGLKLLKYSKKTLQYSRYAEYSPLIRYVCLPGCGVYPVPIIDTPTKATFL